MVLEDFIEFLKEFPSDYEINLHTLNWALEWEKQDVLDVEPSKKDKVVNFYMYLDKNLNSKGVSHV